MAEKVISAVIKVDLQCYRCYKKIRKVLCSIPEIRDQIYDEKQKAVKITVVSCCPERILKKISHKGGQSVEKIEIVSGDKKEQEKKKEGAEKAKDGAGGKEKPEKKKEGGEKAKDSPGEKKKDEPEKKGKEGKPEKEAEKKTAAKEPEKKKEGEDKPKDKEGEKKPKEQLPMPVPAPVAGYPSIFPPVYPLQAYYDPYNQQVVHVGPVQYHQSHEMPDYYGPSFSNGNRGTYYGYQYDYFTDENPSSCTVM